MMAKAKTPPIGRPYDMNTNKAVTSTIDLFLPNSDAELARQTHLAWLGDMTTVWKDFTGKGVHVGIYDEGVQKTHWDLDGNYDASRGVTIDGTMLDGQPVGNSPHGTSVAGLIAAERNGRGGVGVAYNSGITGVNVFADPASVNATDTTNYLSAMRQAAGLYDVTNHSYGVNWTRFASYMTSDFDRQREGSGAWEVAQALQYVAKNGREGLGTNSVFAAANSSHDGQYSYAADRHAIAVAAFRLNDGHSSSYSNFGSHLLVSAASSDFGDLGGKGQVTTDLLGADGYNMSEDAATPADYTDSFGGTSGAAPIVTGVVSLMLDANENLGWRDVKNILAASAKMPLAFETGPTSIDALNPNTGSRVSFLLNNSQFKLGGDQGNWNGGAMHYSIDYGYGAVDAYSAVRMAEVWGLFKAPQHSGNEAHVSSVYDVGVTAKGTSTGPITATLVDFDKDFIDKPASFKFNIADNVALEHVDIQLDYTEIQHVISQYYGVDRTDPLTMYLAQFKLTAPDGTQAFTGQPGALQPSNYPGNNPLDAAGPTMTLSFANLRGVESKGDWTLEWAVPNSIQKIGDIDLSTLLSFTLNKLKVDMYGSTVTNDDVYTYTNEFFDMAAIKGEGSRKTLVDTNDGDDWINAAAVSHDITLSLVGGQSTSFDGEKAFTIGRTSVIENAVTGDGDDALAGNRSDNFLVSMRGNDTLNGGNGDDWLMGGQGNDRFLFDNKGTSGKDLVLDFSMGDMIGTQTALRGAGADGKITVAANTLLLLDGTRFGDTAQLSQQGGAVIQAQGQKDGYFWYSFVSGTNIDPGDVIREASFQPETSAAGTVSALAAMGKAGSATPTDAVAGLGISLMPANDDHGSFYLYDAMAGSMSGGVLLHA